MPVTRLGYLGFETAALDAWKSFGPDVLGLAPADGGDDETLGLRMDDHPARLVLHAGQQERLEYIGWEVSDLAELRRVLDTAGIAQRDASDEESRAAGSRRDGAGGRSGRSSRGVRRTRTHPPPHRSPIHAA